MKRLILISALLLTMFSNTFAQWYVYRNSAENPTWLRIYAGFNYASMKETINGQSISFQPLGATIGGVLCPNLTFNTLNRKPLFFEVGAEVSYLYGHSTDGISIKNAKGQWVDLVPIGSKVQLTNSKGEPYETKAIQWGEDEGQRLSINMMYVSIPMNLTYYFDIAQNKVSIAPLIGANFRFNVKSRVTCKGKSYNRLKDEGVNIFQLGAHVGFNVIMAKGFSAGYRFQYDIMKYTDNTTTMNHSLQIGYRF